MLNEGLAEWRLPLSCLRAVLTLLPKKGDLTDIKNWCPVSLICSNYKLLSKTLPLRLTEVIEQIIHQTRAIAYQVDPFLIVLLVCDIFEVV